jgi:hypothetical protein
MSNIHSKGFSSNRLKNIVDSWGLEEAKVNGLDVREGGSKLQLETHVALEGHVLDENGHSGTNDSFSDADGQADLGVDLSAQLSRGHILNISWGERDTPVHQLNV